MDQINKDQILNFQICNELEYSTLIKLNEENSFYNCLYKEELNSLLTFGIPFLGVKEIKIPIKKGDGGAFFLLEKYSSLLDKGWYPHELYNPSLPFASNGSEASPYFCGTDFTVLKEPKYEQLRRSKISKTGSYESNLNSIEEKDMTESTFSEEDKELVVPENESIFPLAEDEPFLPETLSPKEDLEFKFDKNRRTLIKTSKGVQSRAWLQFKNNDLKQGPPNQILIVVFTYQPHPDYAILKNNKQHFQLAKMGGTQRLSPLGKIIFTYEEILRAPHEWDTFFKFSIIERVEDFVSIDVSVEGFPVTQATLRKLISERNPEYRIKGKDIANQNSRLFIPYSPAIQKNYKDNSFLSRLTGVIQYELFLKKWEFLKPPNRRGRPKKA